MLGESFARIAAIAAATITSCVLSACQAEPPRTMTTLCADGRMPTYFADGAFYENPEHDQFTREWYSKPLSAMTEPSLQCSTAYPVYRFLWLRTFHRPIAVRVEQRSDGMHLFAVELDGAGGYDPGGISKRIERKLTAAQAERFADTLAKARIWDQLDDKEILGLDGARWIVEARDGARYRFHDRWTPESGRVHDLGKVFLELTEWKIPEGELY